MSSQIDTKVMGVFRRNEELLVTIDSDQTTGERYARPLGGKIEHGERAVEALAREMNEELGARIHGPKLLGVLENIFTLNGEEKHEIVFVFTAELEPSTLYDSKDIQRKDKANKKAVWQSLAEVRKGAVTLYPVGLLPLLDEFDLGHR